MLATGTRSRAPRVALRSRRPSRPAIMSAHAARRRAVAGCPVERTYWKEHPDE
jgi:hypothetical protein